MTGLGEKFGTNARARTRVLPPSAIGPLYNEEESLPVLYREIAAWKDLDKLDDDVTFLVARYGA